MPQTKLFQINSFNPNVFKLIVAIYFNYLMIFIGNSLLFRSAIKELFKINKELTKNRVYDSFWYIMEILKKVKNNQKDTSTVMLLNSIFKHQNKCTSSVCKCKLIQIIPHLQILIQILIQTIQILYINFIKAFFQKRTIY